MQNVLGDISASVFLSEYWHKKPLLIRQALPGFKPPVSRDALFAMAASEEVESRLITHFGQRWNMKHGPLATLPSLRRAAWTLLVQGVNLHDDQADRLLQRFRFIPDARLDDLMISYATDGGGVGPHFDSYDVFLLQAQGYRRWRIGAQKDLSLVEGLPLKILRNFKPTQEFVLAPGDMLYLPPQYAHDGIAEGECMTYSIGFRAPSYQELARAFLEFMADTVELDGRYADPELQPPRHPAEIGSAMLEQIAGRLRRITPEDRQIALFLGEYLSEPKANVYFDAPRERLTPSRFAQAALKRGIRLARKTRMLYRGKYLFVNGESFVLRSADKKPLALLADLRRIDGAALEHASGDVMQTLHAWHEDGWIELA